MPFALPAAYALSRFRIPGKKHIMLWYIGLLMAPPVVFLIPYFIFMSRLRLNGTYISMIVMLQTLTIPFSVWLLKSFFDDVPFELEESAQVDGARWSHPCARSRFPLALPGIIVTSMFAFVFSWNNAIFPLVLSNQATATLPIGAMSYFAHGRRHLELHRGDRDRGDDPADAHLPGARALCRARADLWRGEGLSDGRIFQDLDMEQARFGVIGAGLWGVIPCAASTTRCRRPSLSRSAT